VQLIFELSDGSAVRVTAAKWLTPARHALDGAGLVPDVEVKGSPAEQEARAMEILRSAAAKHMSMR
jgi:carboxyl-terminal processing protease